METLCHRHAIATDPASKARLGRIIAQMERNERNRQANLQEQHLTKQSTGAKRKREDIFADLEREVGQDEARLEQVAQQRRAQEEQQRQAQARSRQQREQQKRRRQAQDHEHARRRSRAKTTSPAPPARTFPAHMPISPHATTTWRQLVSAAFAYYPAIQHFPSPPAAPCGRLECNMQRDARALEACACNIRAALTTAGFTAKAQLKAERLRWHPDRFAVCAMHKRVEFARRAKEVFVVVDGMFRECDEGL